MWLASCMANVHLHDLGIIYDDMHDNTVIRSLPHLC